MLGNMSFLKKRDQWDEEHWRKRKETGEEGKVEKVFETDVLGEREEPLLGTIRISESFLGGEGLTGDDEEGGFGVAFSQDLGEMTAVDIATKVGSDSGPCASIEAEGLGDHDWAEIGAADADVDDGIDGLVGVSLMGARSDGLAEDPDMVEDGLDFRDAFFVGPVALVGGITESHMEHGAFLAGVDMFSRKHLVPRFGHPGLLGKFQELLPYLLVDQVLGIVQQDARLRIRRFEASRELLESLGIARE
jgi:hypothetical protein